jgi:hypothetical protein
MRPFLCRRDLCGTFYPQARSRIREAHGPYYDGGHMQGGKLVRRRLSAEQAALMRRAIANDRKVKKLLRAWEAETERLIETEAPRDR